MQRQTSITAHLKGQQLLLFVFIRLKRPKQSTVGRIRDASNGTGLDHE